MSRLIFPILFTFLHICSWSNAQSDAGKLLNGVIIQYEKVRDYQVDVKIAADIPFIKILPMNARIYFRQPGKMKLVSKGIAILPRQGFDQMYSAVTDRKSYTLVAQGTELLDGVQVSVISMLPLSDTMEVIHGKFWIDTLRHVIMKSQMTTRTNGTVVATYVYSKYANFGLPDRMTFLVDVKKFKIPKTVAADINNYEKNKNASEKQGKKGKIDIQLNNYVINKGIPDALFKEKD